MKFSNNKKFHKILIISSILFFNFFVNYSTAIRTQNEILEDNLDDTTNANLQRMVDLYPASMLTSLTDPVELNMIRWQQPPTTKNKRSNQPSVGKRLFLARIGKRGMMMPIYRARVG
uniref:Secreted protein n=2 Tax=Meloidogyne incognita TaxID=6306 RepID=A0A914MD23_MELIC